MLSSAGGAYTTTNKSISLAAQRKPPSASEPCAYAPSKFSPKPADFPALLDFLAARGGYAPEVLEKIAGGNLFRVLKAAEAARQA